MSEQSETMERETSGVERWVLRVGRLSRGRGASAAIAISAGIGVLAFALAIVQRDAFVLLCALIVLAASLLTFERRVFDRIVCRQADEIARLRGGGGE